MEGRPLCRPKSLGTTLTPASSSVVPPSLGASHFLKVCLGPKEGLPPRLNIELELAVQNAVREMIRTDLIKSAHDCSEGGLAVALAECCFNPDHLLGAEINVGQVFNLPSQENRKLKTCATLFSEMQSRIVISVAPENVSAATDLLEKARIPFQKLGVVGGETLSITVNEQTFSWPIEEIHDDWFNSIRNTMEDSQRAPEPV